MLAPIVVKLSRPVDVIDQHFTELKVREPSGADMLEASGTSGVAFLMTIGAACANLPLDALKRMPACDVLAVTKAVSDFLDVPTLPGSGTSISNAQDGGAAASNT